ncbi:MAG: hypothetical protein ACLPV8_16580 [Steroidobacteraceae bacterium]
MSELDGTPSQPESPPPPPRQQPQSERDSDVPYDTRIARAIDRVLEVERDARSAIADCEKQGRELMERARQQRRHIADRAHDRIVALHTRAARALKQQVAQVREQHGRPVSGGFGQGADHAHMQAALEKLADRLIGAGSEET